MSLSSASKTCRPAKTGSGAALAAGAAPRIAGASRSISEAARTGFTSQPSN